MTITSFVQKMADFTKSAEEKQKIITVSEVWHLNNHLQMRYDVLETTHILKNYTASQDLVFILEQGVKVLQNQVEMLEALMGEYQIPLPLRPAFDSNSTANIEIVTDRYIFRRVFKGIQSFIPIHATAFTQSTDPRIREIFKSFLYQEIELYDKFMEYGKIKGFDYVPPRYRA